MLVPVFGMAAAAIAFTERPTSLEWVGGATLLAGVAVPVVRRTVGWSRPDVAVEVEPAAGPPPEAADLVKPSLPPPARPPGDELDDSLVVLRPTGF